MGLLRRIATSIESVFLPEQRFTVDGQYPYVHGLVSNIPNNIGSWSSYDYERAGWYGPSAMRLSTVFTCILVRAEGLSSLPVSVYQSTGDGSRVAYNHPAYKLVHNQPNPFQTASQFWKSVSAHMDLYGNAYAVISYSGRFQPTRIELIEDPTSVRVLRTDNGDKVFEWSQRRYKDYEMLHFRDLSLDGIYGCSRIKWNASTLSYAGHLKSFGSNAIGVKPPGYFSTEQSYDTVKKQEKSLSDTWKERIQMGDTPVLPFGLKYNNLMISPSDAQYLDAVDATKEDIYGIFRVPPTLAQNYERATFANAEQQSLVYVQYTMLPMIVNVEQELNSKLFSDGNVDSATPYYVKFNTSALMRGDFKTRTEGYRTLWQIGQLSGNQIADLEEWNHFPGGDRRYVPMNMMPVDKVDDFVDKLTEPVATNAGDPGGDPNARSEMLQGILFNKNGKKVNGHAN